MANVIRHKTSQPTKRGKRRGDVVIGTGNENYGPTSTTGYVAGITPPDGGYTIYTLSNNDDPAIYVANNNTDLINIARTLGGGELNYLEAKNFLRRRNNTWIVSNVPNNTITDGLILDLNARNESSFMDNIPTSNLIYTNSNVYQLGNYGGTIFPVLFPGEIINGSSQGNLSWADHCRWYNETIPAGTTISISGWYMAYNSNPSTVWNSQARLIIYSSAGYGGTVSNPGAWNTWDYFELTYNVSQDTTSWRLEDAGYDYYNSSDAPNTAAYTCNVQIETTASPTPFTTGSRSQNTEWKDLSGTREENTEHFTLYGLTYPESSQTPASRDGITPGYDNTTNSKIYNASRDVNYYVFDEDSNSWVDDSYFNGERIDGHSYDTYDGQPNQHDQFNQDWDAIVGDFPNATHIIIASHAAERFWTNAEMLGKLKSIGLPDGVAGNNRPEFILVGKIDKPHTWRFHYENISSNVAKMNLGLPLEKGETDLYNGASFDSNGWLEFDGSNDRAYTSYDITYGNETTWVATVKRDSDNNNYNMFMGNFLPYFGFRASTNYKVHFSNDVGGQQRNVYSTTQTVTGKWYHVTFTTEYNSPNTTMRVFLDGVEEGSGTWSSSQTQRSGESKKFTIGDGRSNATWYPLDGKVSNVKIYNRKLSDSEIKQNFYGGNIVTDGLTFATDAGHLVSYEKGSTSAYSLTGSIEGTLVNGVAFNSSKGGTWTFDDSDDKITFPNNAVFNHTSELTIESWVKFDGNSNDFIFEKGNVNTQYSLFSHGTDIVFRTYHAADSGYTTLLITKANADITNGQWHHIVGSWDGSIKRIYVDGQDKGSQSKSGALTTTSQGAAIGAFGGTSSGYYFGGDIAIVRIYNKGLSQDEVLQNFNAQKARFGI